MKKYTTVFIVVLVSFLCFTSQGCIQKVNYKSLEDSMPTISVKGEAKIETVPDEAIIRFGTMNEERSLSKAYRKNTQSMNDIVKIVKDMGVLDKDIRTSSYSVTPIYPRDEKGYKIPGKPSSFRVSQQLTVKLRDTSMIGKIMDNVISSGSNVFNGIQFTSSMIEDLEKKAKVNAALDAKEKAVLLAESLGVKIGRVLRVSESSPVVYPARNVMAFKAASAEAGPSIESGSMQITATCNVVYEVVQ